MKRMRKLYPRPTAAKRWAALRLAALAIALGLARATGGCSLQSLDYLHSGPSTHAGNGGSGLDAGGAATGDGSSSGQAGVTVGGRAPTGGAGATNGGDGSSAAPASAGLGAAAGSSAMAGAGAVESAAGEGGVNMIPGMVYGIDGQSCSGGVSCPGGVSCCQRLEVPAGSYAMGTSSDANALADEKPQHTANVALFELDEFEVTVGRLRHFFNAYDGTQPKAGAGAAPNGAGSGWQLGFSAQMPTSQAGLKEQLNCDVGNYQTWTDSAGVRDTMPANCVSWFVAFAFCIWDGGRLPSEAEWEMASTGGADDRLYPWGSSALDPATNAVANCLADGTAGCAPSDLLPVNSRPAGAGKWGHRDLAGSLWEWTLDYYDATYYQSIGTCDGCVNIAGQTPRVIRGGNFTSLAKNLRATGRASKPPINVDPYAGFRCARSP